MQTYSKSVEIDCSLEELFRFHTDTNNLIKITPKDIKAKLITKNVEIKEGAVLVIESIKNFIPSKWIVRIKRLEEPYILVDEAIESPFAYWEHTHLFYKDDENKTIMEDRVVFKAPFGIFGDLLNGFIKSELEKMFTFRHKVTKDILEEKK